MSGAAGKGWVIAVLIFILAGFSLQIASLFLPRWFAVNCNQGSNHLDIGLWYICSNGSNPLWEILGQGEVDACFSLSELPETYIPGERDEF